MSLLTESMSSENVGSYGLYSKRDDLSEEAVKLKALIFAFLAESPRIKDAIKDGYTLEENVYSQEEIEEWEKSTVDENARKREVAKEVLAAKRKIAERILNKHVPNARAAKEFSKISRETPGQITFKESLELEGLKKFKRSLPSPKEIHSTRLSLTNKGLKTYYCMFKKGKYKFYIEPGGVFDSDNLCEEWLEDLK